ncbi:MAG TPA: IclR family transcriptional regulator [Dongiaceae bacterium]|jgi:DNA-binding IclR family transcriptional regulator
MKIKSVDTTPGTITAVKHAIDVLRCFSGKDISLGVTELATRVGLHKSSISRIVATLEEAQFVERDEATGRFKIGLGLVALSAPALVDLRLDDIVRPFLRDLAARAGETASFNIWDGAAAVCIDQELSSTTIAYLAPLGIRRPAHCTAVGKALLAHAADTDIEKILGGPLPRFTARTITARAALTAELTKVRQQGYAVNNGEYGGDVGAIAATIKGASKHVVGAIALTVPIYRFQRKRRLELTDIVISAAQQLSRRLGGEA